jgi:phosphoserine phosphatase
MKKNGIELVCFDLNKTLIEETTWDDLNVALGMTVGEDQYYLNEFNAGKIAYKEWVEILLEIYKTRGKANLDTVSRSVSKYTYKQGAKEIIAYLKSEGYSIALISGSIDILVDMVAKELGIEMAEANNIFVFDENNLLKEIATFDEDDLAKLRHLESFCRKLGIALTQCACIGDGDNDIKLFEQTQHGIIFQDSKIKEAAWKVIDNLQDLKSIL